MLLNFLWFGLILLSVLADLCSGHPFSSSQAALSGAAAGIELTLSLAGPICLWSALARAMEQTGLTVRLCRALRPGLRPTGWYFFLRYCAAGPPQRKNPSPKAPLQWGCSWRRGIFR